MSAVIANSPSVPLYHQLAESVQQLIEGGTLRPGHRVPSVRRMALQREVSISTVIQAYTVLEDRGLIEARPQSGYYVRARLNPVAPEPRMARPMAQPSAVGVSDLAAEIVSYSGYPDYLPLGAACPHHSLFPTKKLARLLGAAGRDDPTLLGQYSMNGTHLPLSREIARRYLQAGAPLDHDELVITIGCTEALNLALRAVAKPGDTVAIETPSYFGILQTMQALGLKVLEIPTDPREGLCLDSLRNALETCSVAALIVTPTFHNPLGSCMSDARKAALYHLLGEFDLPAIEDDIYGDLHWGERRPKPLKAWDTEGRVLLCSSFSKTLAPSLRVGWCAPGRYRERVQRLKFTNTMATPIVLQKTVADFLRNGGYDHHLRGIRRAYRDQVQRFSTAIVQSFPLGTRLSRPQGGFVLWLELDPAIDTMKIHGDALRAHINIAPGRLFSVRERYHNCLRLNCGIPWDESIARALRDIGSLCARQLK
ncbi:PLP-dependent aminotransferase family protein [Synoicihabitans lomoniglobus]|uniref:PLP-dependent aminotransferase family protein n=1 Tax=Synoicihabitans lomoniglobus TaxID=2909285 RepID=A0AAE9ZZ13_9BACT|nr:PLP-dependent aminotransferase family protein [Opitutaceae bacterium LMO-M01]WED65755.1 PLP-dependent aminotransferase family protein [Opitutaceae bacterium LMO-M01]